MHPRTLESRYLTNDLIKNKGVNLALLLILTMSAFLMSTGAVVMERLVGSVDALFEQAKPPHFLHMHTGDYDRQALTAFAGQHSEIDSWLVEDMLGFDGAAISWRSDGGPSGNLSDSLIDNLFVTQNTQFDFLLDDAGQIPEPSAGEVYVPIVHQQRHGLQLGDQLTIATETGSRSLTVQGFVRDAQMASSLSSATRFLVSDSDFQNLEAAGGGDPEIIVEYRLSDPALASQFQTAYEADPSLPKNGQAVTYQMIRLINAFSDGLVAMALVFISGLLMAIALFSLRFVIRGTVEDEVHEIGVMKAIGLPHRSIAGLYLTRYRALTITACVLGGGLSIVAARVLTGTIQKNYAVAPMGVATFLAPALALTVVHLSVIVLCRTVLRGVRRVEVVGALVHGSVLDENQSARRARRTARRARRTHLADTGDSSMNRRLAWLDLRADAGQWALLPIVFALAALVMTLPTNLLTTFESPQFVTYMGSPESDLRVDVQFTEAAADVHRQIMSDMLADPRIDDVFDAGQTLIRARGDDGWEPLRVMVGNHRDESIQFLSGGAPGPGEIALSVLNADHYSVSLGQGLPVRETDSEKSDTLIVSGIYQDVTSGGRTAKMLGTVPPDALGYVIHATLSPGIDPAAFAREYGAAHRGSTVVPMRAYVEETLASVTDAFRSAALLAAFFGLAVSFAITVLFLKLRLTRERSRMGVLTALGFSSRELAGQVMLKVLFTVGLGTAVGTILAATIGEAVVGGLLSLSGLGITRLSFIPAPWLVHVTYPALLLATGCLGAVIITSRLHAADKSSWLRS